MTYSETLLLGLIVLVSGLGIIAVALLLRAAGGTSDRRSEGFGIVLIGPIPIFFRGQVVWALVVAALILLVVLLVALGVVV
ncbi:MAG: DUF131 domain-containing protein [Thaumarchaeota archaeon]|nr:DUF131 domain-containing protein [Candidatus Calditenuaceae archaeon]